MNLKKVKFRKMEDGSSLDQVKPYKDFISMKK
jgi:hypothetical protein